MPRSPRYIPEETLVEVTVRTLQGRFLLRPSKVLVLVIIGILARAVMRYGVRLCAFVFMSNHCHLLMRVTDAAQMSDFMRYVNSNVACEAGRLHRWGAKFWGRRYTHIVTSHEPEAQVQRLRYILEQGVKEALVESPLQWPGATAARALASGEPLRGIWIDRTALYRASVNNPTESEERFTSTSTLELAPLPCWDGLPVARRQSLVRQMIREIVAEHRKKRGPKKVLGRARILQQNPHDRPKKSPRSPAPRFHAIDPEIRRTMEAAYRNFVALFRGAAEQLREGVIAAPFPPGSFPSPGRFVPLLT